MARTRGIFGNKPALDSSPFSDVLSLDSTYVATSANVVYPSVGSGSFPVAGLAIAQSGGMARPINNQYIYFKKSNTWDFFKYPATQTASSLNGTFTGVTATPGGTCVSFIRAGTADVRVHNYLKDSNGGYSAESSVLATGASISSNFAIQYNPAGTILAMAASPSPYIYLYSRNGATLTRLSDPAILPPDCSGNDDILDWSPDGQYLAMCNASSPYFTVWKVSGTTFTKINNPATLPASGGGTIAWNHNGNSLAVSAGAVVYLYNRSGDTLTYASSFTSGKGTITSMDWNHNGTLMAINGTTGNYSILQRSGDTLSLSGITLKTMSGGINGIPMFRFSRQAYDSNNTSLLGFTNGTMWFNTITTGGVTTKANILGTTTGFANNDSSDNPYVTARNFCFIYN